MKLLIVESPAKTKTISKYLGSDFRVMASVGHVRDLKPENGSVHTDDDWKMDWQIDPAKEKNIRDISNAMKSADELILATDPDREGEAISWHLLDILRERKVIGDKPVKRVVFHEITKRAVQEALKNPRGMDDRMVNAYLARRALDYLVGFNLSPVLWRKLPGSKSAGRVQSVALRLVAERENEIQVFKPKEYWSLDGSFANIEDKEFAAKLTLFSGDKVQKFSFKTEEAAKSAKEILDAKTYKVAKVERKQTTRSPVPPFTTSTLQQEASRKLRFSADQTMKTAQALYENGYITYMRTDSVALAQDAIESIRAMLAKDFGEKYLPESPVKYGNKSKNAQEAHEAVRPSDITKTPVMAAASLNPDQAKLYELIWKRTLACQMTKAEFNQVGADLESEDKTSAFRAVGTTMTFDGFLNLYQEGRDDDKDEDEDSKLLPALNEGDVVKLNEIKPEQHFTQPPARFSEATLVKHLEERGIGRPSTYATILKRIVDREYVTLEKRKFHATDRGRIVVAFLKHYFKQYMEYDYTAQLEDLLDDIANGREDYKKVLNNFWSPFIDAVNESTDLKLEDIQKALDDEIGEYFFVPTEEVPNPRVCPQCGSKVGIRIGRFGGFIGCEKYPDCRYTRPFPGQERPEMPEGETQPSLGVNPETKLNIYLKKGPYGDYIQEGEAEKGKKPKRVSLPKDIEPSDVTFETALALIALPKKLEEDVEIGIGRYGPYVKSGGVYHKMPADKNVLTLTLEEAKEIIDSSPKKGSEGINLGVHPKDKKEIMWFKTGRYGPYVKHGRVSASIPKEYQDQEITLDIAMGILIEKEKKAKK